MSPTDSSSYEPILTLLGHLAHRSEPQFHLPQSKLSQAMKRVRRAIQDSERESLGDSVLNALETAQERAFAHSVENTRHYVNRLLCALVEKYRCNSGRVYVVTLDGEIHESVAHHCPTREPMPNLVAQAIAARRVKTWHKVEGQPPVAGISSHSQLAICVPVLVGVERDDCVGALLLEADADRKSSRGRMDAERDQARALLDAGEMGVPLICLQVNEDPLATHWPWAPGSKRWGVDDDQEAMCRVVGDVLKQANENNFLSSTIYDLDWEHDVAWMSATDGLGFDYPFGTSEMGAPLGLVPLSDQRAVTGRMAQRPKGSVDVTIPSVNTFYRWDRAKELCLTKILSTPVFAEPSGSAARLPIAVWHLFQFRDEGESLLPSDRAIQTLGEWFGEWIVGFQKLRRATALTYLRQKMTESAAAMEMTAQSSDYRNWHDDQDVQFNLLKEILVDVLDADGCSIFVPDHVDQPQRLHLHCSTGIKTTFSDTSPVIRSRDSSVFYDLATDRGLMTFLFERPEVVRLRLHSIESVHLETLASLPPGCPTKIIRQHMEWLDTDTPDRRFLGCAIRNASGQCEAVVRVVRAAIHRPFSEFDGQLLTEMVSACERHQFWLAPQSSMATAAS